MWSGPRSERYLYVNAISASPDGTPLVVAGRDVLQVLKRSAQGFEEAKNLRAGHKGSNLVPSHSRPHFFSPHSLFCAR